MRPHFIFIVAIGILFQSFALPLLNLNTLKGDFAKVDLFALAYQEDQLQPEIDANHIDLQDTRPDYSLHTMPTLCILLALIISILSIPVIGERYPSIAGGGASSSNGYDQNRLPITMLVVACLLLIVALLYVAKWDHDPNYDLGISIGHHIAETWLCFIALVLTGVAVWLLFKIYANTYHTGTRRIIRIACALEFIALLFLLNILCY